MSLRALKLIAVVLMIIGVPGVEAQRPDKIPRIGYLVISPLADPPSAERAAFLDGLRELGYIAGRNILVEYRSAAWNRELLPDLAAELIALKVDVIVAVPGTVDAARNATIMAWREGQASKKRMRLTVLSSLARICARSCAIICATVNCSCRSSIRETSLRRSSTCWKTRTRSTSETTRSPSVPSS